MSAICTWLAETGYQPQQAKLFEQALTHRSYSQDNNERLEFLGDALLDLIIGEALYHQFPQKREGDLSRFRAELVKGETLAQIARELGFSPYLRLGTGEKKSGGGDRDSILAGSFEAVIGAIYLDSDFHHCQQWVSNLFAERLASITDIAEMKDPKTALQELLQARFNSLPDYQLIKTTGKQHQQVFHVACSVAKTGQQVVAKGSSKKLAEQNAARQMLGILQKEAI